MLSEASYTNNQIQLINELRKIYLERFLWFRSLVISITNNLDDVQYVQERFLRTSSDFANVIGRYYGQDAADAFEKLSLENRQILVDLIYALNKKDSIEAERLRREFVESSHAINEYVQKLIPYFNTDKSRELIFEYYKMFEIEIIKRLTKQYNDEINFFDIMVERSNNLADNTATGLIKQLNIK